MTKVTRNELELLLVDLWRVCRSFDVGLYACGCCNGLSVADNAEQVRVDETGASAVFVEGDDRLALTVGGSSVAPTFAWEEL